MKNERKLWTCPRCGKPTRDYPAISRRDNTTEICSACGTSEALFDFACDQARKRFANTKKEIAMLEMKIAEEQSWLGDMND